MTTGIDRVIELAGGVKALTLILGVTTQAIYLWRTQGYVSPDRAIELEGLYGVPRADLVNPDLLPLLTQPNKAIV